MNHPQDLLKLSTRDKIDVFVRKAWAWNPLGRMFFRQSMNTRIGYNRRLQYSKLPRGYEKKIYAKILKHGEFEWAEENPAPENAEYKVRIGDVEFKIIAKGGIDSYITDANFCIWKDDKLSYKPLFNGNAKGDVRPLFRWWFENYVQNRFNHEYFKLYDPALNEETLEEIVFERSAKSL